ncbi:MAG: hypothetical protein HYV60_24180, partial [Planctomycetia bacterium]|nr:hypothetical protein [Planctomycetia bacterium]
NLFFCTKEGVVKRTALNEFANPRKGGIMALKLPENDSLVNVLLTDGSDLAPQHVTRAVLTRSRGLRELLKSPNDHEDPQRGSWHGKAQVNPQAAVDDLGRVVRRRLS